jgi:hypothetical protein
MGTQRVQMKGVLPWLVHWTRRAGTTDFRPALAALVSLIQNNIFLTAHLFTLLATTAQAQQPGQAGVMGRLSLFLFLGQFSTAFGLCD